MGRPKRSARSHATGDAGSSKSSPRPRRSLCRRRRHFRFWIFDLRLEGLQRPNRADKSKIKNCKSKIDKTMIAQQHINPATAASSLPEDRKSTRLNSSHANISYAVFCLKKK